MNIIGKVESLWRYPVKSMQGEVLPQAFLGFPGIFGDRLYAIRDAAAPKGFPYLTAREQQSLLSYKPRYRHAEEMIAPENLAEAEALAPGITPAYPSPDTTMVDVQTPDGTTFAINDPLLMTTVQHGLGPRHELTLCRSDRAMTDCRPISLLSLQTATQLGQELGTILDKRRFRANLYLDLGPFTAFAEEAFVGRQLRVGNKAIVAVLERDPRCKVITLDPDSGAADPEVMKLVARAHEGKVGVYAAVLVEGAVLPGDDVALMN